MTIIVGISGSLRAGSFNAAAEGIPQPVADLKARIVAAGELTDAALRKQLTEYLEGYAAFVAASAAGR